MEIQIKMANEVSPELPPGAEEATTQLVDLAELPAALRVLRTRAKVTQAELTRRGGPDFRSISHWETGRKQPSLQNLVKLLNSMGADLGDLQEVLDQLAGTPAPTLERLKRLEQRIDVLENWRFESTVKAIKELPLQGLETPEESDVIPRAQRGDSATADKSVSVARDGTPTETSTQPTGSETSSQAGRRAADSTTPCIRGRVVYLP